MKKFFFFFFISVSIHSYSQDTIKAIYRPWVSNRLYLNGYNAKVNSSVIKVVDLKGHIRFVGRVGSDCGVYEGETKEYFSNGQLKAQKLYLPVNPQDCPVKEGTWVYYKKNGVVKKTITYSKGVKTAEGK